MQELLRQIEAAEVPAHSPIEQRWTSSSSSPMSPAAAGPGSQRQLPADTVHSWVGIIMYLPTEDPQQRQAITDRCGCISVNCMCVHVYMLLDCRSAQGVCLYASFWVAVHLG
jgi:hypothetical protein